MEAIGDIGYGLTTECWWSPWHPFKSSLTDQTCQQLADAWTTGSGKEWNQTLLHYAVFEIVVDSLKRTKDVEDKQSILDAIKATDLDTIQGHITWSAGAPLNPVPNVCRTVLVGGMWTKGTDYPFELLLVDTAHAKEAPFDVTIPTNGKVEPIQY
jgi:branched-chain amino acid transport system substrate-binding protein